VSAAASRGRPPHPPVQEGRQARRRLRTGAEGRGGRCHRGRLLVHGNHPGDSVLALQPGAAGRDGGGGQRAKPDKEPGVGPGDARGVPEGVRAREALRAESLRRVPRRHGSGPRRLGPEQRPLI